MSKTMRVLIADDDRVTQLLLERMLNELGFETVVTANGAQAWQELQRETSPRLALIDRMMPEMNGLELCKKIRATPVTRDIYTIILTASKRRQDIVEGLDMGADDYITKPFDKYELAARIHAGVRIVEMQQRLSQNIEQLEGALAQVKRLEGIIPICSYCKRVRKDDTYWQSVDTYITGHSEAQFSHGICPGCYDDIVKPMVETYLGTGANGSETGTKDVGL
jgi:phosphoserine phosphatase RsbU/P